MAASVTVEPGAIIFSLADGDAHRYPLEVGMFAEHDTMTMRFFFDGIPLFWRDRDPLTFAELCRRAAGEATTRRRSRVESSADTQAGGRFKLPYLRVESGGAEPSVAQASAASGKPSKRRRRAEHEHSWVASGVPGGIVRRVCQECRQVSIDLTESADRQIDLTAGSPDPEAQPPVPEPVGRDPVSDPWHGSE
jgi:hypothetical protein